MQDIVTLLLVAIAVTAVFYGVGISIIVASDTLVGKLLPDGWTALWGPPYAWLWLAWQGLKLLGRGLWAVLDHNNGVTAVIEAAFGVSWMRRWIHDREFWELGLVLVFTAITYIFVKLEVRQWALRATKRRNLKLGLPSPSLSLPPTGSGPLNQMLYQYLLTHPHRRNPFQLAALHAMTVAPDTQADPTPCKVSEPVLAFRVWHFFWKDGASMLSPLNVGWGDWQPGVNKAVCQRMANLHHAPVKGCHCGYWMRDDLAGAVGNGGNLVGVVQGWGKVIRHEDGYRSEFASVVAFGIPWTTGMLPLSEDFIAAAKRLAERFDVPLHTEVTELNQYIPIEQRSRKIALVCDRCGYVYATAGDVVEIKAQLEGKPCLSPVPFIPLDGKPPLTQLCKGTMKMLAIR